MDNIHDLDNKSWISRRTVILKQLLEQHQNQLKLLEVSTNEINEREENSQNEEQKLKERLDEFSKSNELNIKPCFLFNSNDEKFLIEDTNCQLNLYKLQLKHAKRMISDRDYKVNYLMKLQTTRRELLMRHLAQMNRPISDSTVSNSVASNEISDMSLKAIIVIQTWPPPNKNTKIRMEKEILFKSDQCLTELRDQFKCQLDYGVPMDLSENPDQSDRIFRGELFKSGFFLIGKTFYNDMRDPNNIDLSASIIEWSAREVLMRGDSGENVRVSRGIGPFKSVRMEDHKFEDLEFRLGCPYLYLHQGDCEHLFTISDIRYQMNDDNFKKIRFPFVTATSIGRKQDNLRCYMCKSRPPHWYTRNNSRLPVDPYFFCENCFYSFNYDSNKQKLGQFQAFLYTSAFGIPNSVVMMSSTDRSSNL